MSRLEKWSGLLTPWNPYSIYPVNKEKEAIVDSFIAQKKYDAIVIRYVPEALTCGLMKYADRLIIDVDDHPKDMLRNQVKNIKSIPNKIYHILASYVILFSIWIIANRVKAALFSNPEQVVGKHGYLFPNVAFEEKNTSLVDFKETTQRLFFVGNLNHVPNYIGLDHFLCEIWPIVLKKMPSVELHIAGKIIYPDIIAPYLLKWKCIPGVSLLGFVENIDDEYETCRATIAPIYFGAGTNIKILESIQRKRVCITTPFGVRGLSYFFTANEDVLVARTDEEYAEFIINILNDEKLNHQIASRGGQTYQKHFSHKSLNELIEKLL